MFYVSVPFYEPKIWGSYRIFSYFDRKINSSEKIGESFELSGLKEKPTIFTNGVSAADLSLPIVIKFIDAAQNLSFQVHPSYSSQQFKEKFEVWYVLEAKPGSKIYCGWKQHITKEEILYAIKNASLERLTNSYNVQPGDFLIVPPGTIHAIGAGVLLCEVQNNSADTLRLYDWGRPRPLHIDEALKFMHTEPSSHLIRPLAPTYVFKSPYFDISIINVPHQREIYIRNGVLTILNGNVTIQGSTFSRGTSLVILEDKVAIHKNSHIILVDNYDKKNS